MYIELEMNFKGRTLRTVPYLDFSIVANIDDSTNQLPLH